MRNPKTDDKTDDATPPGGRALERARQFAESRGLPPPAAGRIAPRPGSKETTDKNTTVAAKKAASRKKPERSSAR